jgi:hypothetical protein
LLKNLRFDRVESVAYKVECSGQRASDNTQKTTTNARSKAANSAEKSSFNRFDDNSSES